MAFTWGIAKTAAKGALKGVGGWFSSHIMSIAVGAGVIALAAMLGSVFMYVRSAERAKGRVTLLEYQMGEQNETIIAQKKSYDTCKAANEKFAEGAAKHKKEVDAATLRIAALEKPADEAIEVIEHEAENFKDRDTGCRSLHSSDFPQWYLDWVRGRTASPDSDSL
jgi:hypothetical protein